MITSMDTIISYDEVVALVANPPSILPRQNFTNLRNLRRHIQRALMRVSCPQSSILGWAGLVVSRAMYGLFTTSPFRIPTDAGPLAIYNPPCIAIVDTQGDPVLDGQGMPTYQAQPAIGRAEEATIDTCFKRAKKYWESYQNIQHVVFNCLDDGIDDAFKVSNDPALAGWNLSMGPGELFDQITATYRRPTNTAPIQKDTLFRSVYSPHDTPEVLFRCIKDCQEVQILGEDPYMAQQLLNNAVRLLLQSGVYTHDFKDWDSQDCSGLDMDNPQDIPPRMLHTLLKYNQYHHRRTRICAERVCCTNRRVRR